RGQDTGQFPAPGRAQDPTATGPYPAQPYDSPGTGQFAAPGYGSRQDPSTTGQFERPQTAGEGYAPLPPAQHRPQQPPRRQEPEALPPAASSGDVRTPLYEALETNWFQGGQEQQGNGSAPQAPPQQSPAASQRPAAASAAWRATPNDELVRQAERVRQPAAGGITTSGLPRRVPRANLVPGTAQQQQHQTGPQVSRSPDEVRGRLTNLRRGIAQGRQAGSGQTGSFRSPTHQQER
ncbi:nitrate- and nitrite sensing domain-containing protein, partial [Streptomyces sp. NPDC002513]